MPPENEQVSQTQQTQPAESGQDQSQTQASSTQNEANPVLDALEKINSRMDGIESKIQVSSQPSPIAEAAESDVDKEIELRKGQLSAVKRGEIDAQYEPEIISRLSAAEAKKQGEAILQSQARRGEFIDNWNRALNQAYEIYPDLKDPNSDISKELKAIAENDRVYMNHLKVARTQAGVSDKTDYGSLDPGINMRLADQAYARVQRKVASRPLATQSSNSGLARTALEGRTTVVATPDELSRLENKAAESGDRNDWLLYFREREKSVKART